MSYFGTTDWWHKVKDGDVDGYEIISKFGALTSGTTAITPVCSSGFYRTPTSLTSLEIVSTDNTNDKAGGAGALTVTVIGIGTGWADLTETVTLNGTTAVALSNQFLRVHRMFVASSGAYATQTNASHASTITLRESGGGATWATINAEGSFGLGQSLIGAYSVASGYKALIFPTSISIESNKAASVFFFSRENADDVTTPYSPLRVQKLDRGIDQPFNPQRKAGLGYYTGPCDIGFMAANTSGTTSSISINFEILKEAL